MLKLENLNNPQYFNKNDFHNQILLDFLNSTYSRDEQGLTNFLQDQGYNSSHVKDLLDSVKNWSEFAKAVDKNQFKFTKSKEVSKKAVARDFSILTIPATILGFIFGGAITASALPEGAMFLGLFKVTSDIVMSSLAGGLTTALIAGGVAFIAEKIAKAIYHHNGKKLSNLKNNFNDFDHQAKTEYEKIKDLGLYQLINNSIYNTHKIEELRKGHWFTTPFRAIGRAWYGMKNKTNAKYIYSATTELIQMYDAMLHSNDTSEQFKKKKAMVETMIQMVSEYTELMDCLVAENALLNCSKDGKHSHNVDISARAYVEQLKELLKTSNEIINPQTKDEIKTYNTKVKKAKQKVYKKGYTTEKWNNADCSIVELLRRRYGIEPELVSLPEPTPETPVVEDEAQLATDEEVIILPYTPENSDEQTDDVVEEITEEVINEDAEEVVENTSENTGTEDASESIYNNLPDNVPIMGDIDDMPGDNEQSTDEIVEEQPANEENNEDYGSVPFEEPTVEVEHEPEETVTEVQPDNLVRRAAARLISVKSKDVTSNGTVVGKKIEFTYADKTKESVEVRYMKTGNKIRTRKVVNGVNVDNFEQNIDVVVPPTNQINYIVEQEIKKHIDENIEPLLMD